MQKKLLVLAVAGALGAPMLAQAQSGTVQMFGTLAAEYGFASPGTYANGDHQNVDMMQNDGSEIGFKGQENLGGGLAAWFQCASTADFQGISGSNGTGGFCSRNSGVGLKGAFGDVWIGNWDTPFKRTLGINRIVNDIGLMGATFMIAGGSTTETAGNEEGVFARRERQSINYDSPKFGGFQFMLATNTGNSATSATTGQTAAKPRLLSLGGTYNNGPLNIAAGYEKHNDFVPGFSGTDKAWHIEGGYQTGPVKLGLIYTKQKFEPAAGQNLDVAVWHLAANWHIAGPHGLRASYTRAGDTSGNYVGTIAGNNASRIGNAGAGGTGANLWQIAYVHTLSKRTELTAGYVKLDNKANAKYSLGGLGAPAAGTDQSAWVMTMVHKF